jgi:hypothetical protein
MRASQAAEKVIYFVVPNEVRNLSFWFKRRKREIPRRTERLGMTKILVFPQSVQPAGAAHMTIQNPQAEARAT